MYSGRSFQFFLEIMKSCNSIIVAEPNYKKFAESLLKPSQDSLEIFMKKDDILYATAEELL